MKSECEKKKIYFDMDDTIVDFKSGLNKVDPVLNSQYDENHKDEIPGIFALMEPIPGAIEAVRELSLHYDCYILTTAPWRNPSAWSDKLQWVQRYFGTEEGTPMYKRIIITHHKELLDDGRSFLVDDKSGKNGSGAFGERLVHFGPENSLPDWSSVLTFFKNLSSTESE